MKKKLTAVVLSLVLALSSMGTLQVRAADTTGQEAAPVQEEAEAGQAETIAENASEGEAEQAETADAQNDIAQPDENGDISGAAPAEAAAAVEDPAEEESGAEEEADPFLADSAEDPAEEEDAVDAMAAGNVIKSGSCGDHVKWTLTGTGSDLTLTFSGSGPMEDLWEEDIPWASNRTGIRKVVVEDGITSVGDYVCYSLNKLTDISLPDSLTSIGEYAFENCRALQSIWIPDNVTEIGGCAFSGCSSLKSVNIPDGVTSIGDYVFNECSSLKNIKIPDGVTEILDHAFAGCSSLTDLTLPEGLLYIDDCAFSGCSSLTCITIPDSVTVIADAFGDCDKLKRINYSDWTKWYQIEFSGSSGFHGDLYINGKKLTEAVIPKGETEVKGGPISGITSIKKVTIPDTVLCIGEYAFKDCVSLESIKIPDSVTSIEQGAFSGCSSLPGITIPDSVNSIYSYAFEGCDSLKSLTIPDSVEILDNYAFPRKYSDSNDFIVFTHNPDIKETCEEDGYAYFDRTAPSIAKTASYNGSDIRVYFDHKDEALEPEYSAAGYVTGYHIKYADNKNMTDAASVILKDKKASSKVITGLKNGRTYYVQIQHYAKLGKATYWSRWSRISSVTVGQNPYPANIEKLSTYIGSHIRVDWPKTAGASGYHIKYADNSGMNGAKEVFVKGNSTFTKTLTGLKNGKTYYVKIQTYRTASGKTYWSPWSKAKSIKVGQIPYGSSIKNVTWVSDTKLKLTWDKAPGASGYHIQYQYDVYDDEDLVTKEIFINGNGTLSTTIKVPNNILNFWVRIQTFRKVSGKTYWSSWSKWK